MERPQLPIDLAGEIDSLHLRAVRIFITGHDNSKYLDPNQTNSTVYSKFDGNGSGILREQVCTNRSSVQVVWIPEHEQTVTGRLSDQNRDI
jgi:hypothetical protein